MEQTYFENLMVLDLYGETTEAEHDLLIQYLNKDSQGREIYREMMMNKHLIPDFSVSPRIEILEKVNSHLQGSLRISA